MKRRLPSIFIAVVLVPLLLLHGCSKSSAPQAGSTAGGEVLPGSVTDAMLDTDQSRAQAALAPVAHSAVSKVDASSATLESQAAEEPETTTDVIPGEQSTSRPTATNAAKAMTP